MEELVQARYGGQPRPEKVVRNAQVAGLLAHRSVRFFLTDPLPEGTLETMVAAAQSASTSSNLHQWSVVAVTEPDTKKHLRHLSRSTSEDTSMALVEDAPLVLLWVADASRARDVARDQGTGTEAFDHLDTFLSSTIDVSLAAQNAAVAAESLGLGIVFLGSMRNHARELADLLGLPDLSYVAFGMAVGHPDPDRTTGVRPRPAQSVVLHHERYRPTPPDAWVEDYEIAHRDFREREGMAPLTWRQALARATSLAYLDGRENLRPTLDDRGYRLR